MQTTVADFNDSPIEDTFFGNVISAYTRAQALGDGVLIDVTKVAREAGFRWPVALTQAAWCDCVEWSDEDTRRQVFQDESGRMRDVVNMAAIAVKATRHDAGPARLFKLWRVPRDGHRMTPEYKVLKIVVGPGDSGEPVMTIMLPSED